MVSFNPNFDWQSLLGNTLTDVGSGVARYGLTGNALQSASKGMTELAPYRQQQVEKQHAVKQEKDRTKAAADAIISFGGDKRYADAVLSGAMDPSTAWNAVLTKQDPAKLMEINGQLVDSSTGQVIGDYRTPETPKAPTLTEVSPGATLYDPASNKSVFTAPATPKPVGMPSPTLQKEIFETDEGVQAGQNVIQALDTAMDLNDKAWDGPLADFNSSVASLAGNEDAVTTQRLKNIVTSQALESLRATFGASPTEGERQILLEVQGSIGQARPVREAIFKRAKQAAQRRLQFNQQKASGLRTGDYFNPGYGQEGANEPSVDDLVNQYLGQ